MDSVNIGEEVEVRLGPDGKGIQDIVSGSLKFFVGDREVSIRELTKVRMGQEKPTGIMMLFDIREDGLFVVKAWLTGKDGKEIEPGDKFTVASFEIDDQV